MPCFPARSAPTSQRTSLSVARVQLPNFLLVNEHHRKISTPDIISSLFSFLALDCKTELEDSFLPDRYCLRKKIRIEIEMEGIRCVLLDIGMCNHAWSSGLQKKA